MKIEKDKVVTLIYELHSSTGDAEKVYVEKTPKEQPFVFLFGKSGLILQFEENVSGKVAGDSFEFSITAENAYGKFDLESIITLPKEAFGNEAKTNPAMLQAGKTIPMMDNEGHHLSGKILEVKEDGVVMDFNHPLAGKDLHFKGEVISVREATPEEVSHGHAHEGGHHHH